MSNIRKIVCVLGAGFDPEFSEEMLCPYGIKRIKASYHCFIQNKAEVIIISGKKPHKNTGKPFNKVAEELLIEHDRFCKIITILEKEKEFPLNTEGDCSFIADAISEQIKRNGYNKNNMQEFKLFVVTEWPHFFFRVKKLLEKKLLDIEGYVHFEILFYPSGAKPGITYWLKETIFYLIGSPEWIKKWLHRDWLWKLPPVLVLKQERGQFFKTIICLGHNLLQDRPNNEKK